jgi:hypothetical protein
MRSRFISFKATGLRPNTQYFPFFDGVDVSEWVNTSTGVGGFVQYGSLARDSVYLDASNIYSAATTYPSGLGGKTTKILTDANGSVSGYFLLPRTSAISFKAGKKSFTLMDVSIHNKINATSIATFLFESAGVLQEVENTVLETENIAVGSESNIVEIAKPISNTITGSVENDGPDPGTNGRAPDAPAKQPVSPVTGSSGYISLDATAEGANDPPGVCVIATHGISTGGFSLLDKAKAEIWCEKTYHGKWYGEAFRRGYRHLGNRAIEQGNAHKHYSEFKEFVSYGRGIKKGFMLGLNYYFRTIQFFTVGLFVREK